MMKFYFLIKFSVEMTHLSMKFSHICINIENFSWKLGIPRTDSISFLCEFFQILGTNIFCKESHRTTQQYMICVSTERIVEFRSHYYDVKCGFILRNTSVHPFLSTETYNISHVNRMVRSYALHAKKIIVLSHFWPFKTRFSGPRQYFWLYISHNSCSVTHLTTQSHHEHSNHHHLMWLKIRTIFWSPTRFSRHILYTGR